MRVETNRSFVGKSKNTKYDVLNDEYKAQIDAKIFLEIYDERQFHNMAGPFSLRETQKRVAEMREFYAKEAGQSQLPEWRSAVDRRIVKMAFTAWKEHAEKKLFPIDDLVEVLDHLPPLDTHLRRVMARNERDKNRPRGL